jgi:hypothetical protein
MMNKFFGISLAVLGLALAFVPHLTDCASQGRYMTTAAGMQMPMHCYGNRAAELAVGVPLFAVGAVATFARFKLKPVFFSLFGLAVVLGAAGILMPHQIVGTCAKPVMTCNTIMKPALTGIGSLAILGGVAGMILTGRSRS